MKIVAEKQLAKVSQGLRAKGKELVLTNGCFDLLHLGHIRYLQAARALGDALAVALNGDASVRALKGEGRPLNSETDRAEILAALACVDYVTVFPEVRVTRLIQTVRPGIYVKGGDYTLETLDPEEREALQRSGTEIRILPFVAGHSTSALIARLSALA